MLHKAVRVVQFTTVCTWHARIGCSPMRLERRHSHARSYFGVRPGHLQEAERRAAKAEEEQLYTEQEAAALRSELAALQAEGAPATSRQVRAGLHLIPTTCSVNCLALAPALLVGT